MERIQKLAERDGKRDVPGDIAEFLRQGSVVLFDEHGNQVKLSRAVVMW